MDVALLPGVENSSKFKWAVGACVLIALLSRLSFLGDPFRNDAGIYIYFGKVLWQGGKLYHDFWDTKLPSIALLTAPLYAVFGNHWAPYVLLQAVMGIAAAWLLARAVGKYVGAWAYAPALLFGLVGFNLSRIILTGFQLETIQLFLETLAACMVLRSLSQKGTARVFLVGLLTGLAAMPKPNGLAVGGAAACAYLWESRRYGMGWSLRRILALGVGTAILPLIVLAWVQTTSWRGEMPSLLQEIRLYGSGTPWRRLLQLSAWVFILLPFAPSITRYFLARGKSFFDGGEEAANGEGQRTASTLGTALGFSAIQLFAVCWVVAEVAGVILQRRLYSYHFLVIMPAAVLLFALGRRTRLMPVLISVLPLALISIVYSVPGFLMMRNPTIMPISRYVMAHTAPGDSVWGDPEARLLLETDRLPGSRLQMTFYLVNHDDAPRRFTEILLNDFETRQPKYIVLPQNWSKEVRAIAQDTVWLRWLPKRRANYLMACDEIENYIHAHYQAETTLDGKTAYRRR